MVLPLVVFVFVTGLVLAAYAGVTYLPGIMAGRQVERRLREVSSPDRGTDSSGHYLATEADYLTKHWLRLLYEDPNLRALRLDPRRGSSRGHSARGDGLAARRHAPSCHA